MVILAVFHKFTYKYVDLLYLSFITLIVGSYVSFIDPGYIIFKVSNNEIIKFEGFHKLIIIDLASHLFIFLFVYYLYYNYYKTTKNKNILILNALLLIIIYNILTTIYLKKLPAESIYNIKFSTTFVVFIVATLFYLII
jgi:hypothetical protein